MAIETKISVAELAGMIDYTLLKPEATPDQVEQICKEAVEYRFASVCVNSGYVTLTKRNLQGSLVKVGTTIGFPLGAASTKSKICEAEEAMNDGAKELDMVINIGRLKAQYYDYVESEIREVADAAHQGNSILKVIIEACLLTGEEKEKACRLTKEAGADFVKTSTGFSKGGATAADVALMRKVVGSKMGVKAAGGIRSYDDALIMVQSGASRIGTSSGVKIILEVVALSRTD